MNEIEAQAPGFAMVNCWLAPGKNVLIVGSRHRNFGQEIHDLDFVRFWHSTDCAPSRRAVLPQDVGLILPMRFISHSLHDKLKMWCKDRSDVCLYPGLIKPNAITRIVLDIAKFRKELRQPRVKVLPDDHLRKIKAQKSFIWENLSFEATDVIAEAKRLRVLAAEYGMDLYEDITRSAIRSALARAKPREVAATQVSISCAVEALTDQQKVVLRKGRLTPLEELIQTWSVNAAVYMPMWQPIIYRPPSLDEAVEICKEKLKRNEQESDALRVVLGELAELRRMRKG